MVGESSSHEDTGKAFLYSGGSMKGLGTLPGQPYGEAMGIDDSGRIVGWSYSSRANVQGRAFLYRNGEMEDLGTLPGDLYSMARAIDEHGRVVGQSRNAIGQNRAFLWQDGKMTNLNSLIPAGSPLRLLDAYAIGASGQIVGSGLPPRARHYRTEDRARGPRRPVARAGRQHSLQGRRRRDGACRPRQRQL